MAGSPLADAAGRRWPHHGGGHLPVDHIQSIVGVEGTVSNGVLDMSIDREDIGDVHGPLGVTFTPSFEIHGDYYFQPDGRHGAFFNGDIALKPEETQDVIDAILSHGLIFQAFHQHFIEMTPQIWFIHLRGHGDPIHLAHATRAVLDATATPLPQTMPSNPTTPLDPERLASILHGDAQVGSEGVVSVSVNRTDRIVIDRTRVRPETGISTSIEFKPLGGSQAAVAPDFSMTSWEVQRVVRRMRRQGWFQGCLYNQETNEHPQLYFDHMLKVGDAYALAHEIRHGLDLTNSD
jgi:hypothetical protein